MENQPEPINIILIIPIFLTFFTALWLLVGLLNSALSGWQRLATRYATEKPFSGHKWTWESGQMRWVGIRNCLTVGADRNGLYLAMLVVFRFRHPPLFIPWSDISITPKRSFFRKGMEFRLGGNDGVPLWLSADLAERLRQASA